VALPGRLQYRRIDDRTLAAGDGHVVRKGTTAKLESPIAADADDRQALLSVTAFYPETLKQSPEALRYLETRGLTHPEMIGHFKPGFANRQLGLSLPDTSPSPIKIGHGESEIGQHFLLRNGFVALEPFAGLGNGALFFLADLFIFRGRVSQSAGDRIEHYFHQVDRGGHLIGRQMIEQLPGVLYIGVHG
jgi:hypothetical protein